MYYIAEDLGYIDYSTANLRHSRAKQISKGIKSIN